MANSLVKKITMSEVKNLVGNLAQTNHYLIDIPLTKELKSHFEQNYSDSDIERSQISSFVSNNLGFLCSEATLPVSSYATAEVKDNFMGITQEFAHTRLYTDMDLTFYVDSNYLVLRFFEGWMDYIAGGNSKKLKEPASATVLGTNIYRRFNFPEFYKVQQMTVTKFEKDYNQELVYTFVNVFPKGLSAMPVSYGPADLLKVTVSFNYDRYVVTRKPLPSNLDTPITNETFASLLGTDIGRSLATELLSNSSNQKNATK